MESLEIVHRPSPPAAWLPLTTPDCQTSPPQTDLPNPPLDQRNSSTPATPPAITDTASRPSKDPPADTPAPDERPRAFAMRPLRTVCHTLPASSSDSVSENRSPP